MALTTAQIQNAYVAFFNRPADVAGLTYWSTYAGSTADLLNTFAQSTEYKNLYSGLNNTQIVNAVYNNLFGHTPDVAGLTYWVTQLDQGKLAIGNIADAINKGAQSTDATIIANKTTAATEFTKALDTTTEVLGYAGASSATLGQVKAWLSAVTDSSASLEAATSGLTALTSALAGGTNEAAKEYVLTANQDTFTGTNGNDNFRAVAGSTVGNQDQTTLNSSDIIDGGTGTDALIVNLVGGNYNGGARIKNIETLQIGTNDTAPRAFDYNVNAGSNEVTEVTTIVYDQINGTVGGAEEVLAVNNILKTGDNLPRLHWKNEAGSTAGEIQANYRSSAVAGDTKQAITLENVTAPVNDTTKGNMTIAAGVETFAITSSGSGTNTLNNATGNTPLNGVAVDLVSGNNNTNLTKVVVDGAAGFGKKATVVTLNTDNDYGLTNRAVGSDLGVDNLTADTSGVVRGAASNLVSVATSVTEYDASAATGAQAMRFTARTDGVATNVTFKGGAAADYAEFELGNVKADGGAGDDTFAFINTTANSSFGEGDTLAGGDGADTLQIGVNGNAQTYNISETELRNKTSFGTIDLRGSSTNLTLSSDFVAAADTANSIVVRTDKIIQTSDTDSANSSTVLTNNGLENASTHTVNLTKLGSGQSVSFLGGSGSDRLILSDATFNVLKTLDGGVYNDSTVRAAGSNRYDTITVVTNGENVVIDGQDLSNVKNFEGFTLTKNANAATYNVTLTQAFLTNNTQATDNTNTAILDQVFRIGTANAANNRALAAGDTVTINVADLLNTANTALASGWSSDRKLDITSLEQAGVTVNFVGNTGAAVTVATLRALGAVLANGGDVNTTDVTTLSAANPGAAGAAGVTLTADIVGGTYTGTANADTANVSANNTVSLGGGDDILNITAAITGASTIDLGTGTNIVNVNVANGLVTATDIASTGSTTNTLNVNADVTAAAFNIGTNMDIFQTVNFTADQVSGGNLITINNNATTITAVGGDFQLGTGGDNFNASGSSATQVNIVTGGAGADTIVGGAAGDTIANLASGSANTAGDVLTGNGGADTFILRGDVASSSINVAYAAASRVTDFVLGTDILSLSATNTNYNNAATGFAAGIAAAAAGATAIQDVGQSAGASAYAVGTDLIKLTTGVATTTNMTVQQIFNAAIGTSTVTGLGAGAEVFVAVYDTTNARMLVGLVDAGANTTVETADVVTLVGTIDMTAANYAAFSNASLALVAA